MMMIKNVDVVFENENVVDVEKEFNIKFDLVYGFENRSYDVYNIVGDEENLKRFFIDRMDIKNLDDVIDYGYEDNEELLNLFLFK